MTRSQLDQILRRFKGLAIGVVGDFFLDRYLDLDRHLTETSLETGLDAYQVVAERNAPGGGGNVAKNLAALGIGRVAAISCIGVDGSGFELKRCLDVLGIDRSCLVEHGGQFTPTYTKPMMMERSGRAHEMNRADVKNRRPLPRGVEREVLKHLGATVPTLDGLLVVDQVQEPECGVITTRVRRGIEALSSDLRPKPFFADSRCRITKFRNLILKPNRHEAAAALGLSKGRATLAQIRSGALAMSAGTGRPVFVTLGRRGCLCAYAGRISQVPTYLPPGRTDIVGAGDSFSAGAAAALCAGARPEDAALIGNLVASITVEQIGVTGTATRAQVRRRFAEFLQQHPGQRRT